MAAKLTLSMNPEVVAAAKKYAAQNGRSVSELVENYLAVLTSTAQVAEPTPPQLARWRGSMSGIDAQDHKAWLVEKFGS